MRKSVDLRVGAYGRMVLPKALRQAMGLTGDTKVIATVEGNELRLTPILHGALRAQELYRRYAMSERTVDDFLAERRSEADAEEATSTTKNS
ncbi:AbrB/MazE/SpoVT family DNA-binding domain-containing protein [Fulvimarina endophytica]|uniref:AbrB/MazE/SpoVT family DNA-binding domain-containing protein n=1 Tax=Fulvimarina endophytica TaxID=2293836 RepID=A0A371WXT5_9HYPH|nr:AbrB/MazE/SpoVT family DNA-binding domain-containing protein [Fulvimarina endophytica]RFC61759.1 AbrB/MazE/SpoVT family DNA-binding domain-containing protein [Fulvimarina endophytica]